MSAFTKSMALKKPSSNAAPLRATFLHTVQTSIRSNNSLQNSKLSFARLRHTVSKKQPSRLTVSARLSPTASAKSCQQNAPHISQIQGMVNLNGKRSKLRDVLGRLRLKGQPSSRTGENSPYGMIGGIEETSASFEARSAPRSYPTQAGIRPSVELQASHPQLSTGYRHAELVLRTARATRMRHRMSRLSAPAAQPSGSPALRIPST